MLQAFIDDSRSTVGSVLVLAGYVATADAWSQFSDDWQELLPFVRPSSAFKMSELATRWGPTDERIEWFYRRIEKHVLAEFSYILPLNDFDAAVAAFPVKFEPPINPYHRAFSGVLENVAQRLDHLRLTKPIEVFFDEQGESNRIMDHWSWVYPRMPEATRSILAGRPNFVSDEDYLPLQAADFLAWWRRRNWEARGDPYWVYPWEANRHIPGLEAIDERKLILNDFWGLLDLSARVGCRMLPTISISATRLV